MKRLGDQLKAFPTSGAIVGKRPGSIYIGPAVNKSLPAIRYLLQSRTRQLREVGGKREEAGSVTQESSREEGGGRLLAQGSTAIETIIQHPLLEAMSSETARELRARKIGWTRASAGSGSASCHLCSLQRSRAGHGLLVLRAGQLFWEERCTSSQLLAVP